MSRTIYLDAPCIGELEKDYLCRAIDSGFVSTIGPLVEEFETLISKYLSTTEAVSVQSGTAALHIALHELGIGSGDEVIVPALTFIASVNPVIYVGATPVIVDVDRKTWNIDPVLLEAAITPNTKAIIPVHLYGNPCDMDSIMAIARKHNLFVIEDATESLGATFKGIQTGTFGDFGCFSFNGNKTITTGGGGMVVGCDSRRLEHIKFLVNQARDESQGYFHPEVGFNYRMTNIEAALGLAQMRQLGTFLNIRKQFNQCYRTYLETTDSIHLQGEHPQASSSFWLTCGTLKAGILVPSLQATLRAQDIQTRRIFIPLTEQPPYKKFVRYGCPVALEIFHHGICLPSSALNTPEDVVRVCAVINDFLGKG
jgi:perosamine synthetase